MSSRGFASLQVAEGLPEVLGCPWVADHAVEVEPVDAPVRALGDEQAAARFVVTCWDKGYESGVIDLDDVNWFDDATLIAAAPQASWQTFLGSQTEQPGLWLAYTPGVGLVEGSHVDQDVMIPVEWADPATRTGHEDAQLARITAVRAALQGLASTARGAGAEGGPLESVAPQARVLRMATQPVLPGTPAISMRPPTPGRGLR